MELLPENKERLIRYVDFMELELSDFQKFAKIDWKTYSVDRDIRRNLERWIENVVNCSIDIAKVLLVSEIKQIPASYKGILMELGATEHFDETFGKNISQWASLRNILAHEYLDIRWTTIKKFVQTAEPVYMELTGKIKSLLLNC
ncbi:MAG: type VII toxin-antitoxin system HepT family RNase toxin [Candidatus Anammoxibacter sp.]